MNDQYRECPFCDKNGFQEVEEATFKTHTEYRVACTNCGAHGPNEISVEQAIKMWNLRRPFDMLKALHTQCQDLLIEMVQQFCDKCIKNSTGETVYLHNYMSPTEEVFIYLVSNNLAICEMSDGLIFKDKKSETK